MGCEPMWCWANTYISIMGPIALGLCDVGLQLDQHEHYYYWANISLKSIVNSINIDVNYRGKVSLIEF